MLENRRKTKNLMTLGLNYYTTVALTFSKLLKLLYT